MRRRDALPRGFTLIEVMVALTLGTLVLLAARTLLEGLADQEQRVRDAAAAIDERANGERMLRTLVGNLDVASDDRGAFSGNTTSAHFTSWCDVPSGWMERCDVTVAVDAAAGTPAFVARVDGGRTLVLRQGFHTGALRYLESAAERGTWFESWGGGVTAPLAIGVILDRDTLIVRIGERG